MANREDILKDDFRQFRIEYDQAIANVYVAKRTNYDLSKNDFTDALKNKLEGIDEGAQKLTAGEGIVITNKAITQLAATSTKLGGIKVQSGSGLFIGSNGQLSVTAATNTVIGGIMVPDNKGITLNKGNISLAPAQTSMLGGVMVDAFGSSRLSLQANGKLSVPLATTVQPGVVKIGTGISQGVNGIISIPSATTLANGLMTTQQVHIMDTLIATSKDVSVMTGASALATGRKGLVPNPGAGQNLSFLRGDGSWVVPTNDKVSQASSAANGQYPILLKADTATTNTVNTALFNTGISVNPSLKSITATTFNGKLKGNFVDKRTIITDLWSYDEAEFDGSENVTVGIMNILPISHGGTGSSTTSDFLHYYLISGRNAKDWTKNDRYFVAANGNHDKLGWLDIDGARSWLGVNNAASITSGILSVERGGTGLNKLTEVTVGTANSLTTARALQVSLSFHGWSYFDGSTDVKHIGIEGILPVAYGGTGAKGSLAALGNLGITAWKAGTNVTTKDGAINVATGSSSVLGVLKVGSNISSNNGIISLSSANVIDALGYTPMQGSGGSGGNALTGGTGISVSGSTIGLKNASTSVIGGVKVAAVATSNISLNNGAINVPAATSSQAGVIKFDGSDSKLLVGNGTWSSVPFAVYLPVQKNHPIYDVNYAQTPVWQNYDASKMTIATVSATEQNTGLPNIASLTNDTCYVSSALSSKDAGYFIVKFTPRTPYVWGDGGSGVVGTRNTRYTYWRNYKRKNEIDINIRSVDFHYGEPIDVEYSTTSNTSIAALYEPDYILFRNHPNATVSPYSEIDVYDKQNSNRIGWFTKESFHNIFPVNEDGIFKIRAYLFNNIRSGWIWTSAVNVGRSPLITLESATDKNYEGMKKTIKYNFKLVEYAMQLPAGMSSSLLSNRHDAYDYFVVEYTGGLPPILSVDNSVITPYNLYEFGKDNVVQSINNSVGADTRLPIPYPQNPVAGDRCSLQNDPNTVYYSTYDHTSKQVRKGHTLVYIPGYDSFNSSWFDTEQGYTLLQRATTKTSPRFDTSASGQPMIQDVITETKDYLAFDYSIIVCQPNVSKGQCKLTIKSPNHNVYYRPKTVTVDIRRNAEQEITDGYTTIVSAFRNNTAKYQVGDYFKFKLSSDITMSDGTNKISKDKTYRAVLIGIRHNYGSADEYKVNSSGTKQSNPHNVGHFCIMNDDSGNNIAFSSAIANSSTTVTGGWNSSALKTWLNGTFLNALPFKDNIVYYAKSAYNGTTNYKTYSKIWLPSVKEIIGANRYYIDDTEESQCAQYLYFSCKNAWNMFDHTNITKSIGYWTRDVCLDNTVRFAIIKASDDNEYPNYGIVDSTEKYGVCPCFCLG